LIGSTEHDGVVVMLVRVVIRSTVHSTPTGDHPAFLGDSEPSSLGVRHHQTSGVRGVGRASGMKCQFATADASRTAPDEASATELGMMPETTNATVVVLPYRNEKCPAAPAREQPAKQCRVARDEKRPNRPAHI